MKLDRKMTIRLSDTCYKRLENYADVNEQAVGIAVRELVMKFLDLIDQKITSTNNEILELEVWDVGEAPIWFFLQNQYMWFFG